MAGDKIKERRSIWVRWHVGNPAGGGVSPPSSTGSGAPKASSEADTKATQRAYWLLLAAAAVCVLTLSGPDYHLLAADATLKIPYVGLEASVASFLIFGPIVLIGLWLYLHLAQERIFAAKIDSETPFLLALPGKAYRLLLYGTWYLFVPVVMALFAWKAHPRPEGEVLGWTFVTACGLSIAIVIWRLDFMHRRSHLAIIPILLFVAFAWFSRPLWQFVVDNTKLRERRVLDLVRANFEKKDLRDTVLRKAWLDGANLKDAFLQRADLSGAYVRHARLEGASVQGANLSRAKLDFAKMRNVWAHPDNINRAEEGVPTNFHGARLHGATIEDASFTEANLVGAEFNFAVIVNTPFREARMERVKFINASLSKVDMAEIESIADAQFNQANLAEVVFDRTSIANTSFQDARMQGVHFVRTPFVKVSFAEATLQSLPGANPAINQIQARSRFQTVKMETVNFRDAILLDVLFIQVTLNDVSFSGAQLIRPVFKAFDAKTGVRFSNAKICRAEFATDLNPMAGNQGNSRLAGVDFSGAFLYDVGFGKSDLRGAKFDNATLTRVDLSSSLIDKSTSFKNAQLENVAFPIGAISNEACSLSQRSGRRRVSSSTLLECKPSSLRMKPEEVTGFRTLCDVRPQPSVPPVVSTSAPAAGPSPREAR